MEHFSFVRRLVKGEFHLSQSSDKDITLSQYQYRPLRSLVFSQPQSVNHQHFELSDPQVHPLN